MKDKASGKSAGKRRGISGISSSAGREETEKPGASPLSVTVKNGHLKYARHPVIIGHFRGDGIVSAESVMDFLLGYKLSEREGLGLYPGPIGSNLVILPEERNGAGAIIVGLGEPEALTPFLLSRTIERGCLEYLLQARKENARLKGQNSGITTLLVGSGYGNLSLASSINAILEGITNANHKAHNLGKGAQPISEVEFMELYRDKALNAYYVLDKLARENNLYNINLSRPAREVEGNRTFIPIEDDNDWWKRITAIVQPHPGTGQDYIYYSASTGRARTEVRPLFIDPATVEELLQDNNKDSSWNRELAKAIFELLVPNDFKIAFRDQQNILLVLDKSTAWYPWELLHYDKKAETPICVSTGMIRQLSTADDRREIKPVNDNRALVIGDPVISPESEIGQLPEAGREARAVGQLLEAQNFSVTSRVGATFREAFAQLFDEYKIIHIASHGVIDYGPEKKTGILLSEKAVLTTAHINQISSTPELVFINCCYLGEVAPSKEEYFRDKYRLAANIGAQFIENGVKAVVAAGWAVDDEAARRFAEAFYTCMLEGESFGDAVRAARAACYREFSHTNTWGAYQCYGDPFYKLVKDRKGRKEDRPYIMDKEALIDLEAFISKARFAKTRGSAFPEKLAAISRRIDASGVRNGRVTEMEAMAYAEIEAYEASIEKYGSLFLENKANFSLKALEQWCNLRAHRLVALKKKKEKTDYAGEMDSIIGELQHLIRLGKTIERYSLLGSAHKRNALLVDEPGAKRSAIEKMAEAYKQGYTLQPKGAHEKRIYQLTNWLLAELLLNDDNRMEQAQEILGQPAAAFLDSLLAELNSTPRDNKEFWDLIEIVNVNQCRLLLGSAKDARAAAEEIKAAYRSAWRMGGSYKQKNSELAHMEFVQHAVENLPGAPGDVAGPVAELIAFFRMEDPQ